MFDNWEELEADNKQCKKCRLCQTRNNVVFGTGNRQADIMFIGEGPGADEDLQGEPFVGKAGKLMNMAFETVGLKREDVYIANILKCRPPKNRDPLLEEEEACIDYLREQVRIIQPKIIVCLGRIAAMKLIKPDYKITKEHGTWVRKGNFLMTAVYHPAALLRDPRKNEEMLLDMKNIKIELDKLKSNS